MKDIVIVANFCRDFSVSDNGRFVYLAKMLSLSNSVEIITSDFYHATKKKRDKKIAQWPFKVTFIEEPGYYKNVSLRRFYSHYVMGKNLSKYLKLRKKPDIIYCAIPSLDVANVTAQYAKKNNIKFIIDIQDLWPEAFKMIFNVPIVSDILFWPMKRQADYIYSIADEIVAVSQTYVDRAMSINKKCNDGHAVFLGTELSHFDKLARENRFMEKPSDQTWIVYIGTLGYSYDLRCVIDGLKILKDAGITDIKFIVMGDGPLKSEFEEYAKEKGIFVEFTGRLGYEKMVGILTVCDIAVNPIKKGSAGSIINKVGDYAAAGLPVLNTQECQEYRSLINEYNAGINCINGDPIDFSEKLSLLYHNENLRKTMKNNSRKLAEDKFNREKTYVEIINLLLDISE